VFPRSSPRFYNKKKRSEQKCQGRANGKDEVGQNITKRSEERGRGRKTHRSPVWNGPYVTAPRARSGLATKKRGKRTKIGVKHGRDVPKKAVMLAGG
jgi:hypothetical protein